MIRSELAEMPLSCPLDGRPLQVAEHGLACERGHNYNVSRHGYVNLLPVKLKPSRDPGDSRPMVDARTLVMQSGLFEPLASELAKLVCDKVQLLQSSQRAPMIVDAGCGEGYYTNYLREALADNAGAASALVLGVDISKWAITAAAKHYKCCAWAVGNNKRLPVLKGTASIITSLFGFETWHPWADLQDRGQFVITASPGPRHLIELRNLVYNEVVLHDAVDDASALAAGYERLDERMHSATMQTDEEELRQALLTMTPHSHRMDAARRSELDLSSMTEITIEVLIRIYQRQ